MIVCYRSRVVPTSPHPSTFQRCLAIATRGCCVDLWSHGAFDTLLQGLRKYSSNVFLGQHSCACIAWLLLATLTLGRGGSVRKNTRLRGPSLGSVVLFKMGAVNAGPPQCGVGKEYGFVVGIVHRGTGC